jgi:hypothetical protein
LLVFMIIVPMMLHGLERRQHGDQEDQHLKARHHKTH